MITKQQHKDRNLLICSLYAEGQTQEAIGERFQLSKARVGQILFKAGLVPEDRIIANGARRSESLSVKLSKTVKAALAAEASRVGTKSSALAAELIYEAMTARKIPIVVPRAETPLFEE
jgi:hypothetical protein